MKLLYFSNIRIPTEKAHAIQIMKMCEAFAIECDEVELIIPTRGYRASKEADVHEHYMIKKIFRIHRIFAIDPLWLLRLPNGIYIKIQIISFITALFFHLLFMQKDDAIAYTRDEYLLPLLQIFFRKVVWEGHSMPKRKKYYAKFWNRCEKVVVITHALKNALIETGVEATRILVAPDAVDLAMYRENEGVFTLRKKIGLPQDKKIIMYAGHFYPWKGIDTLLDTAYNFKVKYSDFSTICFVLVGGTTFDYKKYNTQILEKKMYNVRLVTYKPHHEIAQWLQAADILVLPNSQKQKISEMYTSPMKMFEYMAARKPIIASDLPSLREILNEKNCLFFEPDNPESLAQGIIELIKNPTKGMRISQNAYNDVKKYSWTNRSKNILQFITEY